MLMTWNYDESVRKVSAKVEEWKAVTLKRSTLTDEIAKDLYEAREQLDARGGYRHGVKSNIPRGTFEKGWLNYLQDVGLAKSTVHRWLDYYEPTEQRLLTDAEYELRKEEQKRKQMAHDEAVKSRVDERIKTGRMPLSWGEEEEDKYQNKLEQDRKTQEWRERIRTESAKKEQAKVNVKETFEEIHDMLNRYGQQAENREELASKMRLTGDNATHTFNQTLIDYLESLPDDALKLEACYNIIKIAKNYIREHDLVRG
jgi:hypothetical protein